MVVSSRTSARYEDSSLRRMDWLPGIQGPYLYSGVPTKNADEVKFDSIGIGSIHVLLGGKGFARNGGCSPSSGLWIGWLLGA